MSKVLVVDDVAEAADALAAMLAAVGHEVSVAYGGERAMDLCSTEQPQVVIMDLDMPGIDGMKAAGLIRKERRCDPRWLIALTGESREEAEAKALASGFDLFMQKPADLITLISLLDDRAAEE